VRLLPASEVPDVVALAESDELLRKQLLGLYKVETIEDARTKHNKAMST